MRSRRERTSLKKNFLFTASPSSSILPKLCAAASCRTTAGSDGPRPPRAENGAGFDALHLLFHENPLKKNKKFFQHRTRAWAFFPFHESSAPAVPSCEMKRHECRHTLPALRQQGGKKGTDAFSHATPPVRETAMLKRSTAAAEASSVTQAARSGMTDLPRSQRKTFRPPQQQTRAALPRSRAPATPRALSMFQSPVRTVLSSGQPLRTARRSGRRNKPCLSSNSKG